MSPGYQGEHARTDGFTQACRGRLTWLAIRIFFVASDRTIRMTIPRLTVATTIHISVLIINNAKEDNDDGNNNKK